MDGPIRQLTFRVEHDCPLATLSREVPGALEVWSGHRFEVVSYTGKHTAQFLDAAAAHLQPVRIVETPHGAMVVWHPEVEPKTSISRRLEQHDLMWLQPLRVEGGWEHYDAISFGESEQAALDDLRKSHPTQVTRRRDLSPQDVEQALFLSMQPAIEAPTAKQAEALAAALEAGYYRSPRGATTAQVAKRLSIGRSAFEERLRGGENKVMDVVVPAMRW